ncbi:hypothetical protein LLB_3184 [Legionella longbeachae D-4968]|nr:hypothetical protein LLB_3184 [Legionella longbeachae D-4968]
MLIVPSTNNLQKLLFILLYTAYSHAGKISGQTVENPGSG